MQPLNGLRHFMAPQALKKAANHEKRKRSVSSMFRRISSMNCHNILEYIVAIAAFAQQHAAASSLCSSSLAFASSNCLQLIIKQSSCIALLLHIIRLSAAVHEIIRIYVCSKASRYIKLHVSLHQIIEMQTAYLQQIKKTAKQTAACHQIACS